MRNKKVANTISLLTVLVLSKTMKITFMKGFTLYLFYKLSEF